MKLPFKAEPEDKIFCPNAGREVSVDAYCHGWTFKNELCKNAETCERYLQYAEQKLLELQERARAKGLSVNQFGERAILKNGKEVKAHA